MIRTTGGLVASKAGGKSQISQGSPSEKYSQNRPHSSNCHHRSFWMVEVYQAMIHFLT